MVARGNLSLCNIPNQYLRKKTLRMTEVPLRCSIKWVVVSSNAVENVQHKRNKKETSLKGQVTFLKLCMYVGCVHCTDHS